MSDALSYHTYHTQKARGQMILVFVIAGLVALKGIIMGVVLSVVLPDAAISIFLKTLIIAATSATFTGIFTVIAAVMAAKISARDTKPVHDDVKDIKHKLEADRRETDE